jgi:hypothetical protein
VWTLPTRANHEPEPAAICEWAGATPWTLATSFHQVTLGSRVAARDAAEGLARSNLLQTEMSPWTLPALAVDSAGDRNGSFSHAVRCLMRVMHVDSAGTDQIVNYKYPQIALAGKVHGDRLGNRSLALALEGALSHG